MTLQGGLRHRMIKDSLYNMIHDSLDMVGWFDGQIVLKHPVNMIPREVPFDEEIPLNTLAVSAGDLMEDEWELGSMMAEHSWTFYVDMYAESQAVGIQMIGDVRDLLAGRLPDAGRTRANFPVYDYRQATPTLEFYCEIDEVVVDKAVDFPRPWMKHWYVCRFLIVDYYGNGDGD